MYFYAQLNGSNVCIAVTQTSGPFNVGNMIALASLDTTVLGKTWSGSAWLS